MESVAGLVLLEGEKGTAKGWATKELFKVGKPASFFQKGGREECAYSSTKRVRREKWKRG